MILKNEEIVSLSKCPENNSDAFNKEITIGDMHGNALRFLYLLIKEGIATGISQEDYSLIYNIYIRNYNYLNEEIIVQFQNLINKIIIEKPCTLRLIGDLLADRGQNDLFTLIILEKLNREKNIDVRIILSNHDIFFLNFYEQGLNKHKNEMENNIENNPLDGFGIPRLKPIGQYESIVNLVMIGKENPRINEIIKKLLTPELIKNYYHNKIKLLDYYCDDKGELQNVFSHARVDEEYIKKAANIFGINTQTVKLDTSEKIIELIDKINQAFKERLIQNTLTTNLVEPIKINNEFSVCPDKGVFTLNNFVWGERCKINSKKIAPKIIPFSNLENIKIIHGHEGDDNSKLYTDNYENLDQKNTFGKSIMNDSGTYPTILIQPRVAELSLKDNSNYNPLFFGQNKENSTLVGNINKNELNNI